MATEILVPEVSDGVTEGTVISINVAVGDKVEADQTLLELETDKAVVAIPAPFAGRITEIKVADGDTVAIGAVIQKPDGTEEGLGIARFIRLDGDAFQRQIAIEVSDAATITFSGITIPDR